MSQMTSNVLWNGPLLPPKTNELNGWIHVHMLTRKRRSTSLSMRPEKLALVANCVRCADQWLSSESKRQAQVGGSFVENNVTAFHIVYFVIYYMQIYLSTFIIRQYWRNYLGICTLEVLINWWKKWIDFWKWINWDKQEK